MPRGNGMGPMGMGPMTGRGAGFCSGVAVPGYANPVGFGGGFGRGCGFGRGSGRGFGYRMMFNGYAHDTEVNEAAFNEKEFLNNQAEFLENQLQQVKKRMTNLNKEAE